MSKATFSLANDLGLIKGNEWRRFPALTCGAAPLSPGPSRGHRLVAAGKQSIEQVAAGLAERGRAGRRGGKGGSYVGYSCLRGGGRARLLSDRMRGNGQSWKTGNSN